MSIKPPRRSLFFLWYLFICAKTHVFCNCYIQNKKPCKLQKNGSIDTLHCLRNLGLVCFRIGGQFFARSYGTRSYNAQGHIYIIYVYILAYISTCIYIYIYIYAGIYICAFTYHKMGHCIVWLYICLHTFHMCKCKKVLPIPGPSWHHVYM